MIPAILSLVLSNNVLVSFVKWLSSEETGKVWLRGMLIVFSILGIIAASALNGTPVDFNQISDLVKLLVESGALAFLSHLSYQAISKA